MPLGQIFSQKNQTFSTMDLLLLVGLVGGVGSVVGVVLAQALQDDRPIRAQSAAENLALQIEAHQLATEKGPQEGRGPASVREKAPLLLTDGQMGKDPWGRPFHYAVRKHLDQDGKPTGTSTVYVWSDGANGKSETNVPETFEKRFAIDGDDVGRTREFKTSL